MDPRDTRLGSRLAEVEISNRAVSIDLEHVSIGPLVPRTADPATVVEQHRLRRLDPRARDVRMPEEDGISAAKKITTMEDPPAVIFCTAYDEYALEAFSTEAVGYLLKPVKQEDLEAALLKTQKLNKMQLAALAEREAPSNQRKHISAKTRRGVELIPLDNVRFFIADHKYVTVHHTEGETLIDDTLKELETEFSNLFVRIHRNALVAINAIEGMERNPQGQYRVRLKGIEEKPIVSRRHVSRLRELLTSM